MGRLSTHQCHGTRFQESSTQSHQLAERWVWRSLRRVPLATFSFHKVALHIIYCIMCEASHFYDSIDVQRQLSEGAAKSASPIVAGQLPLNSYDYEG
jgi:hypothetical protein